MDSQLCPKAQPHFSLQTCSPTSCNHFFSFSVFSLSPRTARPASHPQQVVMALLPREKRSPWREPRLPWGRFCHAAQPLSPFPLLDGGTDCLPKAIFPSGRLGVRSPHLPKKEYPVFRLSPFLHPSPLCISLLPDF